jgi:hypothetical protein
MSSLRGMGMVHYAILYVLCKSVLSKCIMVVSVCMLSFYVLCLNIFCNIACICVGSSILVVCAHIYYVLCVNYNVLPRAL